MDSRYLSANSLNIAFVNGILRKWESVCDLRPDYHHRFGASGTSNAMCDKLAESSLMSFLTGTKHTCTYVRLAIINHSCTFFKFVHGQDIFCLHSHSASRHPCIETVPINYKLCNLTNRSTQRELNCSRRLHSTATITKALLLQSLITEPAKSACYKIYSKLLTGVLVELTYYIL